MIPKHYLPHVIFFAIFFVASVPVLYYYYRRNPNPRFRPTFGEMTLLTVISLCLCGGLGFGFGTLFNPANDGSSLKKAANEGAGWSRNSGNLGGFDDDDDRKSRDRSSRRGSSRRGSDDDD